MGRIRIVSLDMVCPVVCATHCLALSFLLVMTKSIKCQCMERGCIHDVLFRWGRRNTVFVMSNSCSTQVLSSNSPLLLHFPTPFFPRTPSQVTWSVSTLALKFPRRNSFPAVEQTRSVCPDPCKKLFHFLWICHGWCICAYGGSMMLVG